MQGQEGYVRVVCATIQLIYLFLLFLDMSGNPRALRRLRTACQRAKRPHRLLHFRSLSNRPAANDGAEMAGKEIRLDLFRSISTPSARSSLRLTKSRALEIALLPYPPCRHHSPARCAPITIPDPALEDTFFHFHSVFSLCFLHNNATLPSFVAL